MSSILTGIGGIVSGIGSVFGKQRKPDYRGAAAGSLRGTVTMARKLGLHPLAALGHSMSSPIIGDSPGDRVAQAGEALSRAGEGLMAKKIAESEIKLNEAQRMQIEAQTETLKINAAKALIGGVGGPVNLGDPEGTTDNKQRFPWEGKLTPSWDPQAIDVEAAEQRYGDGGNIVAGFINAGVDAIRWGRKMIPELRREVFNNPYWMAKAVQAREKARKEKSKELLDFWTKITSP